MTCSPAHKRWCSADHAELVGDYRDQRDAWELAFEEGTGFTYRPGLIREERRAERRGGRREVTDFVEATPPVTFKDWLICRAGRNRNPDDE